MCQDVKDRDLNMNSNISHQMVWAAPHSLYSSVLILWHNCVILQRNMAASSITSHEVWKSNIRAVKCSFGNVFSGLWNSNWEYKIKVDIRFSHKASFHSLQISFWRAMSYHFCPSASCCWTVYPNWASFEPLMIFACLVSILKQVRRPEINPNSFTV